MATDGGQAPSGYRLSGSIATGYGERPHYGELVDDAAEQDPAVQPAQLRGCGPSATVSSSLDA